MAWPNTTSSTPRYMGLREKRYRPSDTRRAGSSPMRSRRCRVKKMAGVPPAARNRIRQMPYITVPAATNNQPMSQNPPWRCARGSTTEGRKTPTTAGTRTVKMRPRTQSMENNIIAPRGIGADRHTVPGRSTPATSATRKTRFPRVQEPRLTSPPARPGTTHPAARLPNKRYRGSPPGGNGASGGPRVRAG